MRYNARSDSNQQEIVDALRSIGCSVTSLHRVGQGVPDLLCGIRGANLLFEVKNGNGRLTPDEAAFLDEWRGQAHVIRNVDEALAVIEQVTT